MPIYRVYGLTLASDFPFRNRLEPAGGPPDLSFSHRDAPPFKTDWQTLEPLYASPHRRRPEERACYLYRLPDADVMRFPGSADFYLRPGRIDAHPLRPGQHRQIEIQLLGAVLAFWLETRGRPALHASAVAVGGGAVGFLAGNSGGKTGLAAALVRAGRPLLTDDVLALEERPDGFRALGGYPQMRMWPDEAAHFFPDAARLPRVHPDFDKRRVPVAGDGGLGAFCGEPKPLRALYLPRRRAGDAGAGIEIVPVSPRDALLELVRTSFTPYVVEALGLQRRRLDLFTRLVARVPILRLDYPSGFEHLPRVAAAILDRP